MLQAQQLREVMAPTEPLIDVAFMQKPMRSWSEVYNEMCSSIGQHYGLNDIREAHE